MTMRRGCHAARVHICMEWILRLMMAMPRNVYALRRQILKLHVLNVSFNAISRLGALLGSASNNNSSSSSSLSRLVVLNISHNGIESLDGIERIGGRFEFFGHNRTSLDRCPTAASCKRCRVSRSYGFPEIISAALSALCLHLRRCLLWKSW